ncbi:MAG: energy-coupling factor ABC transporter permease [Candidatus Buchananbacteria bacterium]
MHLPDQFLSNQTSFILAAVSAGFLGQAFKNFFNSNFEKVKILLPQIQTNIGQKFCSPEFLTKFRAKNQANKKVEQLALVASFIFALQMLNFPVQYGTSGHFLGGVLAAVVLGPWTGLLAIASVLAVQSLVFSDGGIIALGANIFNMGIIGVLFSFLIYSYIYQKSHNKFLAIGLASWLSVVLAATACSVELGLSGNISFNLVFWAMLKVHVLIGLAEAIITIFAIKLFFYEKTE